MVFDLLRGFFMFGIIVNHLALFPNLFAIFTGATKLWVSMAEGFFMVSGFFIGYLYKDKIKHSFGAVFKKLLGKSFRLYLWTVYLTFLFVYWGNIMPLGSVKESLWIVSWDNLPELILKVISFQYSYGWADILPYYAIFLLVSPLYLWLLNKGWWYGLVFVNFGLWLSRGQNIYLAIQPLFFLGVVAGFYSEKLKKSWLGLELQVRHKIKTIIYGIFVLSLFYSIFSLYLFDVVFKNLPLGEFLIAKNRVLNFYFDKQTVGLGRLLLSPIWFLVGMFLFGSFEKLIEKYFGWLFLAFGKNSLYAYIIHAFVIYPIPFLATYLGVSGVWWNTAITTMAIGANYYLLRFTGRVFRQKF